MMIGACYAMRRDAFAQPAFDALGDMRGLRAGGRVAGGRATAEL